MKIAIVLLAILAAACGSTEKDRANPRATIDCKGIDTCTREVAKLAAADRTMLVEFEDVISRIEHCEPANSTKCFNAAGATDVVRAEQRAWLPWRNAHCDVFAFSMEGTSAEEELRASCRRDLAEKRTEELRKIMSR
jgi:uncharacterized protein YecT (DUF1311 family)